MLTEQKMSYFAPFKISVTCGVTFHPRDDFLKQNAKVTQHLSETEKCLGERQVKMVYNNNNELIQLVKVETSLTEHHWYDIFKGLSPKATNVLKLMLQPMLVLLIIIALLFVVTLILTCYPKNQIVHDINSS